MASTSPPGNGGEGRSSGTGARTVARKQLVGAAAATTAPGATRTTKPLVAEDKYVIEAQNTYKTLELAMHELRTQEYVPAGEPTLDGLVAGLLLMAAKLGAKAANHLVAMHLYAQKAVANAVSADLTASLLTDVTAQVNELVVGAEKRIEQASKKLMEKIDTPSVIEEAVRSGVERALSEGGRAGTGAGTGAFPPSLPPFSYATAASAPPPGPERAAQIRVADRERLLARQILVDGFPFTEDAPASVPAAVILERAHQALSFVNEKPEGIKFVAGRTLSNGGVILECGQPEHAQWLQVNAARFEEVLGVDAKIRLRPFKVVVEFVPIAFDPHEETGWRQVEEEIGIPCNCIVEARWIKPVIRRQRDQRVAHLLLTLNSPTAANTLISSGLTLAGKRVSARKNLAEPVRCAKCHRYDAGHLARDCPQQNDTCGTCGRAHRTSECTRQDPRDHKCVVCNKSGHATWSRDCPEFIDRLRRADARHPENRLRFFPTTDPDSWVPQLDEPARGTAWEIFQDAFNRPPAAPSQRRRGDQARMTQATLDFTARSPPPSSTNLDQNVNRSINAQYDLLHSADPRDYDILAIQEPYIDHLRLTRASSRWTVVYPDGHLDSDLPCRSVLLVNTAISSNVWRPLKVPSPDVTAISLTVGERQLHVFNLYVDGEHDQTLHATARATQKLAGEQAARECNKLLIWLGDFNRHNPAWDEARNHHLFTQRALDRSQVLLHYLADFSLEMALPAGIPTLEALNTRNLTRPDNVFCSSDLTDLVSRCGTAPHLRPTKTDHFPVLTTLNIPLDPARPTRRRNFREVDWDGFNAALRAHLDAHPIAASIRSTADFDAYLQRLNDAITAAVDQEVPFTNPTPFSRRWWSKDLTIMRKQKQRAGRSAFKYRQDPGHPAHEEYRLIRNQYAERIKYARKDCWTSFLDDTTAQSIWTAHRFLKKGQSDGGAARIPALKSIADPSHVLVDNVAKGEEFYNTFFLPPGPAPPDTSEHEYPDVRFEFTDISNLQVKRAIAVLRAFKAPGPDGIPNEVYIHCRDVLTPLLGTLFRATFHLCYYPPSWQLSDTIVLRKPGKTDYTTAKAHQPIALLNCMSKILSRCVADVLVFQAESLSLLADFQFGGRAGRTTTDSIHLVTKTVKDAWRRGKVASVLFLDIKSAFPAATPGRLFHNMRMLGVTNVPFGAYLGVSVSFSGRFTSHVVPMVLCCIVTRLLVS
ncbi:transcription factor [Ganoderma sinense ZZ0214-1]|uniref:Transcription factor n=1 Tax=Ganoderma sinense ZZ0214-1 TaxID=1077348 RepID=A0A2G8RSG6_9APHY|nr:transcription factor [Ganoderma sinense ZZ0214-1]